MENMMRRAISAFMALVLALGMVPGIPMFAGAEEVEPQPETMAVETTEAVAVPEETEAPETTAAPETEAPETVPETTAEMETVPEETVPETTGVQEIVPEETVVEETVPEETVVEETVPQETVIEETVPEVSEEAADANDTIVLAKAVEISVSKDRTFVGDNVKLNATFAPSDTTVTAEDLVWEVMRVLSEDKETGEVEEEPAGDEVLIAKGYLRISKAGVYRVYASLTQYDANDQEIALVSEPVRIEFLNYAMEINETAILEENIHEGDFVLQSGESMSLSVKYSNWLDGEEPKVELPLHTPSLEWSLAEGDEQYASLTNINSKEVTLKAKLVTEHRTITVKVVDTAVGFEDEIKIRLYPDSYKIYILDEDGNDVTDKFILLDMADEDTAFTQKLSAYVWPEEGDEKLVWSLSDTMVELEHELENEKDIEYDNRMIFTADQRSGETVITVKGTDHPDVVATVTIKRQRLIQELFPTKASKQVQVDGLVEGKSVTLQAAAYDDREIVDNSLLTWELVGENDEEYATISSQGVLKANSLDNLGQVVTVRCTVIGKEADVELGGTGYFELYIPIIPKATAVNLYSDTFVDDFGLERGLEAGEIINGKTITVDTEYYKSKPAVPRVEVLPYADSDYVGAGDPVRAKQEVTWKSSNTAVAAFDPLTDALVWKGKNGTTTITATATDGSGKSASVKLQFGAKLRELEFVDEPDMFLRSGKSWTFGLTYSPENATNKAVTWAVYARDEAGNFTADASAIATITANGKLTAKTVYDNHMVLVVASSKEDPNINVGYEVLIRPKTDEFLTLLDDSENCVTRGTVYMDLGDSISLYSAFVGEGEGEYEYVNATWTSSNRAIQVEDGFVTADEKTGTATITAKFDGKQASVTVKVVSRVDYVEVYEKKNPDNFEGVLATGKSLELKADLYDIQTMGDRYPNGKPTVTKVNWVITEGAQYATVNASGKVTANKNLDLKDVPATVTVAAYATDGSDANGKYTIKIYPAAEKIRIRIDGKAYDSYTYFMTKAIDEYSTGEKVADLDAVITPWDESWGDAPVIWKSSNTKIADVDSDGVVTAYKPGSITVTATAADGSGKKATLKLVIASQAVALEWNNDANELEADTRFAIAGGKNLSLKPVFYGVDGKKINVPVEWEISKVVDSYGTAFVKKFSKGTLNTVDVTATKFTEVTIKFDAKYAGFPGAEVDEEGKYAYVTVEVGVYPATTSLNITYQDKIVNKVWKQAGCADFQLSAVVSDGAVDEGWIWKSSNEKIATVDEDGWVQCTWDEKTESYRAGTITITATAKDGSGKKDTITIVFEK